MEQKEIESILNGRNSSPKIDLIWSYDFNDTYDDFYLKFLLDFDYDRHDKLLASYVIDIAYYKKIDNELLYKRLKKHLTGKCHWLVKLSVLDYFKFMSYKLTEKETEQIVRHDRYLKAVLKIEILLYAIRFYPEKYKSKMLIPLIKGTNDYIAYIRLFKGLEQLLENGCRIDFKLLSGAFNKDIITMKSVKPHFMDFQKAWKESNRKKKRF